MKVSLNWLKDYINLDDVSVEEITNKLTLAGLEVDDVFDGSKVYENFVIGYVKEKDKHPNADKLSLCLVTDGINDYKVVCGAPNVAAGQKIVFAKVGAIIPNGGFKITKAKIRGEESVGMICAEDELGLSDDHSGIMVLDDSFKVGEPAAAALGLDDVIIDVDLTPNRADAMSHIGVARDIAAIMNKNFTYPEIKLSESDTASSSLASVEIENSTSCPRYVGKVVSGITIKESPEWLKRKLTSIGMRPINNVVDVTNFVMHEIGQPLHAFDLDKLAGKKIIVKDAGSDTKFTTLDSKERTLNPTDLMICDGEKQVAIAGVMGGENSEVTSATKNILIESAYFDPASVRKTSKILGLSTDASYRFERGVDFNRTLWAAKRAAQLITELAGGTAAKGEIDAYPNPIEKNIVKLRFARVDKVLGYKIEKNVIIDILKRLEFEISSQTELILELKVPTTRPDVIREIDVIEEIARIHGYDNIPVVDKITIALDEKIDQSKFNNDVRDILYSLGFNEIITNSLLNTETALKFDSPIKVLNPSSVEMAYTRPSLLPGMLNSISKNIKVKETDLQLFEIGNIFNKISEKEIKGFEDFSETEHLLIGITGNALNKEWYSNIRKFDFYDLAGFIDTIFEKLFLSENNLSTSKQNDDPIYDYSIVKKSKKNILAKGGKLNDDFLKGFEIKQEVFVFDFNLTELKKLVSIERIFNELLKYPKVIRDFAVIIDKNIEVENVKKAIIKGSSKLLKNIKLFDIFEGESLGEGKRSLAFQLEYFDASRTLKEEEVDKDFWTAIETVKSTFNAQLRG